MILKLFTLSLVLTNIFTSKIFASLKDSSGDGFRMQNTVNEAEAADKTKKLISEFIDKSFPELSAVKIVVKTFESDSNYFNSRFSIGRFMTLRKMRYLIYINPQDFNKNAPSEGVEAIVAHELAHVLYFRERNRFELIGLVALANKSFATSFEHKTDLVAIERGFGHGLKQFREWLYKNVPQRVLKRKNETVFPLKIIRESKRYWRLTLKRSNKKKCRPI